MNAQQLRASILQMAIEGRLVPQDPNEKPVEIDSKDIVPEEEQPFAIPENWRFIRLGNLIKLRSGDGLSKKDFKEGEYPVYGGNGLTGYHNQFNVPENTIVIGRVGFYRGNVRKTNSKTWVTDNALIVSIQEEVDIDYMVYLLRALNLGKSTSQTAQPVVTGKIIKPIIASIPPLAEQKRIVDRIEELMPLVEAYGEAQEHLEKLDKELPNRMKQSILQTAIQGKLVSQDPNDKPVEIDSKDVVPEEEQPFAIPENWQWVRLGKVFQMKAGKFISASRIQRQGKYPCFGGNGLRGYVDSYNHSGRYPLIGRQGALCGNINMADGNFYATEHAVVVNCSDKGIPDCIGYFLQALNLNQYATATAQPGLAVSKINLVPFPLPPLSEQKRISNRIDEFLKVLKSYW